MENSLSTFLIFLAIIVIQLIAAYAKQKKKARNAKPSKPEYVPREATPIPDPFKEIREMMGLPAVEEPEEPEELEELKEPVLEKTLPARPEVSFRAITDRAPREKTSPVRIHQAININEPGQGILWTAILQEPRYKIKWKPR